MILSIVTICFFTNITVLTHITTCPGTGSDFMIPPFARHTVFMCPRDINAFTYDFNVIIAE